MLIFKIGFGDRMVSFFPDLKKRLKIANLNRTPAEYITQILNTSFIYSVIFTILLFFIFKKAKLPLLLLLPIFVTLLILFFCYHMLLIKIRILRMGREIDKEVIFIGRYLLIKLYSGKPLLNSLIEISNSRGIAGKYIGEIVKNINTGSSIENALSNAMTNSPSIKLSKILFHINNALKLGIDVTKPLESVLQEITKEQWIEIKRYGQKVNSLVIFYMIAAVVLPSLGMVLFTVIGSLVSLIIDMRIFLVILFFVTMIQLIFISLFRVIRPTIDL